MSLINLVIVFLTIQSISLIYKLIYNSSISVFAIGLLVFVIVLIIRILEELRKY